MSKREKRIAAQEEKAKIAEGKKAITVAKILGETKCPHSIAIDPPAKQPVVGTPPGIFAQPVTISSSKEDRVGVWSWNVPRNWNPTPGDAHVGAFISSYHEVKTWREVYSETMERRGKIRKKHVSYPVSSITKEARQRLAQLQMDDHEEIFRFRMSNLERLYGVVVGATFITVWYDPTHKIYPV